MLVDTLVLGLYSRERAIKVRSSACAGIGWLCGGTICLDTRGSWRNWRMGSLWGLYLVSSLCSTGSLKPRLWLQSSQIFALFLASFCPKLLKAEGSLYSLASAGILKLEMLPSTFFAFSFAKGALARGPRRLC